MATSGEEKSFSRFDLPGLNLPLNWHPSAVHEHLAIGQSNALFQTALSGDDIENGYIAYEQRFPL
jgi:hypothetical protein